MTKVLLIEDDINIATIYRIKLEHDNILCEHANNGLEGLAKLQTFTPDIILLDLKMPVMDGEEFLRKFRAKPQYLDIPVLVLTNINRTEAPQTLWHLGISGYVVKAHITPSELVTEIKSIVKR